MYSYTDQIEDFISALFTNFFTPSVDNKPFLCSFEVLLVLLIVQILQKFFFQLRDITQLDALQGLPIIELVLDGNPLCDKFKDQATYIRYALRCQFHFNNRIT